MEGVLVAPGATALTRIPSLAHSHPQLIVNLFIAALLAAYVAPAHSIGRLIGGGGGQRTNGTSTSCTLFWSVFELLARRKYQHVFRSS